MRKTSLVINAKKKRKTIEWKDWKSLQENQRYQGNISCKDGLDKGQKWTGMDLREAEDIKKRWQEYMEELYKKRYSQPR